MLIEHKRWITDEAGVPSAPALGKLTAEEPRAEP
jgi:hypothetical protein